MGSRGIARISATGRAMSYRDAREVPDGSDLETDICVIGGGAAGISIATELIGTGKRVILLESGGQLPDAQTQALCEGENSGLPYYPLTTVRLRYLGGTTNHWTGACRHLDATDFSVRDWVPLSGWPIEYEEMGGYYARAHAVCDLGPVDYDLSSWEAPHARPLPLDPAAVRTVMFRRSPPTRFASKFAPLLEPESNVITLLNGNAVGLQMLDGGTGIGAVEVACISGTKFSIKAGAFILATGAIENARLLLHCQKTGALRMDAAAGHWVGRCFMEHVIVTGGVFVPSDPRWSGALYDRVASRSGHYGFAALAPSDETMTREQILNAKVYLVPTAVSHDIKSIAPGVLAATIAAQSGMFVDQLGTHVRNVISEIDEMTIYSYEKMFRSRNARGAYYLNYHLEQAPNPDSRITLGDQRDRLGLQRVRLHWDVGEIELHTLRRFNEIIAAEAGAAGLGRVWEAPADGSSRWPPGLRGAWHQMGTTRMSSDPANGVVDRDCRVHGIDNLYIAGSSVFPTSGHANPTLTLVALALRLADHIKELRQ
jgi:choline dehydrogenase-like flavoprotein